MEKVVHIIPLGHEYDRAVKLFEESNADRAYILTRWNSQFSTSKMLQDQRHYALKVRETLESKGVEVRCISVDLFDFLEVTKEISKIIVQEKRDGNRVQVNMSAAGRLTSVAASLAGMHHNVKVYYVRADKYPDDPNERKIHGLSICNNIEITYLTNLRFDRPSPIGMHILAYLCKQGEKVRTKDLIEKLKELKVEGFENLFDEEPKFIDGNEISIYRRAAQSRQLMKLNKSILEKLENSGYITRDKIGRNTYVSISASGTYVAYLSGLVD